MIHRSLSNVTIRTSPGRCSVFNRFS